MVRRALEQGERAVQLLVEHHPGELVVQHQVRQAHRAPGPGADRLYGEVGADTLTGDEGNDALYGGESNGDQLLGEEGNDALDGGLGTGDVCNGGGGTDSAFPGSCETTVGIP